MMSDETDREALADEALRALKFGEQVADLLLDDGWISPERLAELIAATRRQALDEAVEAIRERAARFDHPNQWVARDLLQTVARTVANLQDGGEE